ncbi:MAG TPA: LytTR family DNA-binding domain-containing protein [Chitinophagaceae bacterium]|nr:LytTR family DNA-binding domain-containing protein [Chitinophagaceae bacterium]
MLKAVLIDDEESNLSSLKEKITSYCPEVQIVAICDNAAKGIEAIDNLHPDIVFLDIEMPVMNGFVMLQQLTYKNFELIFTTAYDHYAIKAIRYSALDYLVKPIEIDNLKEAVNKAEEKRNRSYPNPQIELLVEQLVNKKKSFSRIAIPTTEGLQFIKIEDIIYLEASINYTHIYCEGERKFLVSRTLKDFEDMLPAGIFLRIHNSYIINKNFAEKYIRGDGGQVVLSNGAMLDVAKRKKAEFLKAIGH